MSIQQLLFATSSRDNTLFPCLDFKQVGDSFQFDDGGGSGVKYAFCLGREADYSYTSPNVIWCATNETAFAKFECQNGTFIKVGSDIDTGSTANHLVDMADTGTHIMIMNKDGQLNQYNKTTGSLETWGPTDSYSIGGLAWKSPFFYAGSYASNGSGGVNVYATQASYTRYNQKINNYGLNYKGLVYDHEEDLFYQCLLEGQGRIFSTINLSSDTDSVIFTNEGKLPRWNSQGNNKCYDILKNKNGKFLINKNRSGGFIKCVYKLA